MRWKIKASSVAGRFRFERLFAVPLRWRVIGKVGDGIIMLMSGRRAGTDAEQAVRPGRRGSFHARSGARRPGSIRPDGRAGAPSRPHSPPGSN